MAVSSNHFKEHLPDAPVIYKSPSEYFNKKYFNLMIFISVISTLGLLFCSIYFGLPLIYQIFVILIPIILSAMFILDSLKQYKWATFVGFALLPLWLNVATLCIGQGFSESTIMVAFFIFIYVLYSDQIQARNRILFFTLISHLGVLLYLNIYSPIIEAINNPFDEIMVFLIAIGWILLFLKKIKDSKNEMITNLQHQNAQLVATTQELERFTYIASHDLKSPLRTIISFSDLIDRHMSRGDYDRIKEDLSFIKAGAKQMNYLISDILEFSRISDPANITRSPIGLTEVMDLAVHNLTTEIKVCNARILKDQLPIVTGNETEFVLLFQNLIQNGIKYNNNEIPIIQIWSEQSDKELSIYFKDNGIGIDKMYHDQIFQFFKRLHTSDQYQGTGLGLGLCFKIMKNYNGTISVDSDYGKGSTFCLKMPHQDQVHKPKLLKKTKLTEVH